MTSWAIALASLIVINRTQGIDDRQSAIEEAQRFFSAALGHPAAKPRNIEIDLSFDRSEILDLGNGRFAVQSGVFTVVYDRKNQSLRSISSSLGRALRPEGFDPQKEPQLSPELCKAIGEDLLNRYMRLPWRVHLEYDTTTAAGHGFEVELKYDGVLFDRLLIESFYMDPWSGCPTQLPIFPKAPRIEVDLLNIQPKISEQLALQRAVAAHAVTRPLAATRVANSQWVLSSIQSFTGSQTYARLRPVHLRNLESRRAMLFYRVVLNGMFGPWHEGQTVYVDAATGEAVALKYSHAAHDTAGSAIRPALDHEADPSKAVRLLFGDETIPLQGLEPVDRRSPGTRPMPAMLEMPDGSLEPVDLFPVAKLLRYRGQIYVLPVAAAEKIGLHEPSKPLPEFQKEA